MSQSTALSNVRPDAPASLPAPPPGWLSAAEAAAALGVSARSVDRRCAAGELPGTLCQGEHGPAWHVDPSTLPALRLAAGGVADRRPIVADSVLAGLTEAQRGRAYERFQVVRDYHVDLAAQKPDHVLVDDWTAVWCTAYRIRTGLAVARGTIYRWAAAVRDRGIAGLVDRRGRPVGREWSMEAMDFLVTQYCDEARPNVRVCWERANAIAASQGWDMPSLRTSQAWVQRHVDPKLLAAGRDPKRFRDRCVPDIGRDWSQVPAMGLWVGDHRHFDVFVPCPIERFDRKAGRTVTEWAWRRPWITAYIDARTWKCVARRIRFEDPDANQVMSTFCAGVVEHGKPGHVYLDNGKDFKAARFAGGHAGAARKLFDEQHIEPVLTGLGVGVTWAAPYNAKAKVIEPWFRLVSERFDRAFETYAGNRSDRKPERLKALRRRAGEYAANGFTLQSFTASFDAWLTGDYDLRECPVAESKPHSVADAFQSLRDPGFVATRPAARDLALLLMPSQAVIVDKQGVYVRAFGRHYWSDQLEDRRCSSGRDARRKVVYRYADNDPSRIFVFDATTGRFLAIATPYAGEGLHPLAVPGTPEAEAVTDAIVFGRRVAKRMRETLAEARSHAHELLLAATRDGARAAGRLALPSACPAPPVGPAVIRLMGEASQAAEAGRKDDENRLQTRRQTAAEFFGKTGTTDTTAPMPDRRVVSAADLLADAYAAENQEGS